MILILFVVAVAMGIYAFACKISCLALLMYIQETGVVPDKATITKYTERAIKKWFHIPS